MIRRPSASAEQWRTDTIKFFEQKMKVSEAKKQIRANMKKDQYNNSIRCVNVRVVYVDNDNFAWGPRGFYISANGYYASV